MKPFVIFLFLLAPHLAGTCAAYADPGCPGDAAPCGEQVDCEAAKAAWDAAEMSFQDRRDDDARAGYCRAACLCPTEAKYEALCTVGLTQIRPCEVIERLARVLARGLAKPLQKLVRSNLAEAKKRCAKLTVTVEPPGAQVSRNGADWPTGRGCWLEVGESELQASLEGYLAQTQRCIHGLGEHRCTVVLSPVPRPPKPLPIEVEDPNRGFGPEGPALLGTGLALGLAGAIATTVAWAVGVPDINAAAQSPSEHAKRSEKWGAVTAVGLAAAAVGTTLAAVGLTIVILEGSEDGEPALESQLFIPAGGAGLQIHARF